MLNTVKTVIVIFIALIAAARVTTLHLSDYHVTSALNGDTRSIDYALAWNKQQDKALYLKAKSLPASEDTRAKQLLTESLLINPANMRTLAIYAKLLARDTQIEKSDHLMGLVSDLMPANKSARLRSAAYWLDRGRLDKSLVDWSAALSISSELDHQLFPILARIANNDNARAMLSPLTQDPPDWWNRFFKHMAHDSDELQSLLALAQMRRNSSHPLSSVERESLIDRLITESRWADAYLNWVDGLSASQKLVLGSIYDGGFELMPSGKGFEWRIKPTKHFDTRFRYAYDSKERKSLYVKFHNHEAAYKHIGQFLLLANGRHHFEILVRTDMLTGRGRLKWFVRCANKPNRIIGESPSVIPSKKWRKLNFRIDVPNDENCRAQVLTLETTGKHNFDHKLRGSVWFDQLTIKKQRQ